nr:MULTISPECIES: glutaminase A [unclassified Streptomyces]
MGDVEADTSGEQAGYIPELARADPDVLAAAFVTVDGETYGAGGTRTAFTIQSVSKPFVYALALADRGFDAGLGRVGVEPSGEAFDEISLESGTGRPLNPMINAGAITAHSLAGAEGLSPAARVERVIRGLSAFAGRRLTVDESVYASEREHAHRNLAIAHMLRSYEILTTDAQATTDGYVRQCSVRVTTTDLAVMAATLANRGKNPLSGEQVVPEPVVRQVLGVMFSCGMYDAAGDWATQVGIPAKSGVAGAPSAHFPGRSASPRSRRDWIPTGTACAGCRCSHHVVGAGPNALRVLQRQGGIGFAGAEKVLRECVDAPFPESRVALDLSWVHSLDDVARRMLLEVVRRLMLDGHEVFLVDPDTIMPDPDPGDGGRVTVVTGADHAVVPPVAP